MAGTAAGAAKRRAAVSLNPEAVAPAAVDEYVCGNKPLKMGDQVLFSGDLVPGAEKWPRLESWVRTGRIVKR